MTTKFRGPLTLQVLRVHLEDPGSDSLQVTNDRIIHIQNPGVLHLEPSRSAMVIGLLGASLEIHDWTCNRSVVIDTTEDNIIVRTFRRQSSPGKMRSNPMTRILSSVYVWWGIIYYASGLGGYNYSTSLLFPLPVNNSSPRTTPPLISFA